MTFEDLFARLLGEVERRIRNGSLTERGLARLTNMSQPHVHHILKGKRGITPKVADRFLRVIGMDASDLFVPEEAVPVRVQEDTCLLAPVLEGSAGPGLPAPKLTSRSLYFPFPAALLRTTPDLAKAPIGQYAVVRAGYDALLERFTEEHDLLIVSLLSGSSAATGKPFKGGRVMMWEYEGSWCLDAVPETSSGADDSRDEGDDQARRTKQLLERRRLLHENGKPVAVVHWLLRRMHVGILRTMS